MPTDPIQVLYGQVSSMSADLFLRLPEPPDRWKHVEVKGPYCKTGRTLPTTTQFQPQPDNNLWRAQIIDPVYWSSDHPMLYHIRLETAAGDTTELECGIRRFGCKDGNFWLEAKRWVLRGAWREHVRETELAAWKDARLAMWVERPGPSLLVEAAQQGIMLVVDLGDGTATDNLLAVTQCPAVMLVVVQDAADVVRLRSLLPNTVFAKRYDPTRMQQPPSDADAVLLWAGNQLPPDLTAFGDRPVLAHRDLAGLVDLATARAACDQLQRDLAGRYDLSGYIV